MGLRWMVLPPFLFSSLCLAPLLSSPFPTPIITLFRPASLNYCHRQATTPGEARREDGVVEGGGGGGYMHMDVMRGKREDSCWHSSARYMFTGVFVCASTHGFLHASLHACTLVCLCYIPTSQLLTTRRSGCSDGTLTAAVWHLWRVNLFLLEPSSRCGENEGQKVKNIMAARLRTSRHFFGPSMSWIQCQNEVCHVTELIITSRSVLFELKDNIKFLVFAFPHFET